MYYIYRHTTPEGIPFYIGKGTKVFNKKTFKQTYPRGYSSKSRSIQWRKNAVNGFNVEILLESNSLEFILNKENELWKKCKTCVNVQLNNHFSDYKIFQINDYISLINIFNKVYLLLSTGEIYNNFGKKINTWDNGKGYKVITITNTNNVRKNLYVHRLVAEAFIPNPLGYDVVNHVDLNKANNNKENLMWCTQKENVLYSVKIGSYKNINSKNRIIYQYSLHGEFIKKWNDIKDIAKEFNCTTALIYQCCNNKLNTTETGKGHIWVYEEDVLNDNLEKFNKTINNYNEKKRKQRLYTS